MTAPSSLLERDRLYTWHPFTQEKTAPTPLPVVKAEGIWLELDNGHRLVDALWSPWQKGFCHDPKLGPPWNEACAEKCSGGQRCRLHLPIGKNPSGRG